MSSTSSLGSKIKFRVVCASGEDPEYPASELNFHSRQTRGWQCEKWAEFPQVIGIRFTAGPHMVKQVQILSHQTKIATRIELFAGQGADYSHARFTRLGYISLDDNARSDYKARELKSVFVDAEASFMRFVVHDPHPNPQNFYNQVCVIAINVVGTPLGEPAPPQSLGPVRGTRGRIGVQDLAVDLAMDSETAATVREVNALKEQAVRNEEFRKAKALKEVEQELQRMGGHMAKLIAEKEKAVDDEDYDRAEILKEEINSLRRSVRSRIDSAGLHDVGGPPGHRMPPPRGMDGRGGFDAPPLGHSGPPLDVYGRSGAPPLPGHPPYGHPGGAPGYDGAGGGGGAGMSAPYNPPSPVSHHSPTAAPPARDAYPPVVAAAPAPAVVDPMEVPLGGGRGGGPAAYPSPRDPGPPSERPINPMEAPLPGGRSAYPEAGPEAFPDNDMAAARQPKPRRSTSKPVEYEPMEDNRPIGGGEGIGGGPRGMPPDAVPPGPSSSADTDELSGVQGVGDLPAPDPLPAAIAKDLAAEIAVFGEYVLRCFYSSPWALREAALQKIELDLSSYSAPKSDILTACCKLIARVMTNEKNAQVFRVATELLPAVVTTCGDSVRRGDLLSALDPVVTGLVNKLGDSNARIRDGASSALMGLASSDTVGPAFVANFVLRPLPKRQASAWRPLQARLTLAYQLVEGFGLCESPLTVDALMAFANSTKCFTHSNGNVRDVVKALTVLLYSLGGRAVESHLTGLRPQQLKEYQAAFERGPPPAGSGGGAGGAVTGPRAGAGAAAPRGGRGGRGGGGRGAARGGGRGGRGGGRGGAHARRPARDPEPEVDDGGDGATPEEDEPLDGVCQFCEGCGPDTSEQELDMHYWQECPMLISCADCQQVVEISTLNDHLLDECDHKDKFRPCPTCGEALHDKEYNSHIRDVSCARPPRGSTLCPLCRAEVINDREGWMVHILDDKCPENPRTAP